MTVLVYPELVLEMTCPLLNLRMLQHVSDDRMWTQAQRAAHTAHGLAIGIWQEYTVKQSGAENEVG